MTIDIENLEAGYHGRAVLKPFTTQLCGAGITALIGANGAGKSTLLRTISGAQPPVGGSVSIDSRKLGSIPPKELARCISLVYTDRASAGDLTVEEVAALGRQPYTGMFGRLDADDRAIVAEALAAVGINDMRRRKLATLSDGERQKTMIARALAQATPIMILDEPTSFLDAASRIEVMQLLARLRYEMGKTIILSTHDIAPAMAVADNLWVADRTTGSIDSGRRDDVVARGTMDRVFANTAVRFDSTAGDYRMIRTI